MVRGADAGPVNTTDVLTSFRGGAVLRKAAWTSSYGRPISAAAISACSSSSSDRPWAAAIASSSVGASCRTRRGPYFVFQACSLFLLMNLIFLARFRRHLALYVAMQQGKLCGAIESFLRPLIGGSTADVVIARSAQRDEAISATRTVHAKRDCFAEPVIGPAK